MQSNLLFAPIVKVKDIPVLSTGKILKHIDVTAIVTSMIHDRYMLFCPFG